MTTSPTDINNSALRLAIFGKKINLVDLLPGHLENSEVGDFVQFFENFLNTLYYHEISARGQNDDYEIANDGTITYYATCATSAGDIIYTSAGLPERYEITSADTISILEKAKRINDLHDPDYVDIEYIQRLANLLGYNISITKGNVVDSAIAVSPDPNSLTEDDINKYLRFIISNLPNWYKIKSTKSAVKVLLYSFGIVGELVERWTSDDLASSELHPTSGGYGNDLSLWQTVSTNISASDDVESVPENYFPTPHFNIKVDVNKTPVAFFGNIDSILDSIETIRPINCVLDDVTLLFGDTLTTYIEIDSYDKVQDFFPMNTDWPTYP